MKIKVETVRTWVPQGSRNGPQNHLQIDEKTHLATASENASTNHLKIDEKSIWGYPPDENVSKNTQKNVFRSIKIRKQISVKKYSEKHLPLQNPLERGGLGGAHLDIYISVSYTHLTLPTKRIV